ncbi:MAG: DUF1697 domain-containing protein [Bacteroidales bacterium]|jgi:uncharacterized protein (DUF1697 family)|nr:DUF1697 domain-containing protein [Bacteroidales bacterium]
MFKWIAFLRGINVGGKNMLKMDYLSDILRNGGFVNVGTILQSGNVYLESSESKREMIEETVEKIIFSETGMPIMVIVRSMDEMKEIIQNNPFADHSESPEHKQYVCFLKRPLTEVNISEKYEKEGLKLAGNKHMELYILAFRVGDRFAFPNTWMDKELKQISSARNMNTLEKIVHKFS